MRPYWPEPSLDDLLGDEITRLLMASDGVGDDALRRLLRRIKAARGTAADLRSARPAASAGCASCCA